MNERAEGCAGSPSTSRPRAGSPKQPRWWARKPGISVTVFASAPEGSNTDVRARRPSSGSGFAAPAAVLGKTISARCRRPTGDQRAVPYGRRWSRQPRVSAWNRPARRRASACVQSSWQTAAPQAIEPGGAGVEASLGGLQIVNPLARGHLLLVHPDSWRAVVLVAVGGPGPLAQNCGNPAQLGEVWMATAPAWRSSVRAAQRLPRAKRSRCNSGSTRFAVCTARQRRRTVFVASRQLQLSPGGRGAAPAERRIACGEGVPVLLQAFRSVERSSRSPGDRPTSEACAREVATRAVQPSWSKMTMSKPADRHRQRRGSGQRGEHQSSSCARRQAARAGDRRDAPKNGAQPAVPEPKYVVEVAVQASFEGSSRLPRSPTAHSPWCRQPELRGQLNTPRSHLEMVNELDVVASITGGNSRAALPKRRCAPGRIASLAFLQQPREADPASRQLAGWSHLK